MFARSSIAAIALVGIIISAFVICLLAFFFTFPSRGPYGYIGAPNGEERSRIAFQQYIGHSDRLNNPIRTPDSKPEVVRENGLPPVAIPD